MPDIRHCVQCALIDCALFAAVVPQAYAQWHPLKPVRVIIPAAAGSNTDTLFRIVGPKMSGMLGQPLVTDYRPGAGGVVGATVLHKSPPDGYAIALVAAGFVMNPAITKAMPYDPANDFQPLGLLVDVPAALVVHPSLPVRDVKSLVAFAKARPGQLNFASAGKGSVSHLAGELFNLASGARLVHVPHKSSPPAVAAVLAGHIEIFIPSIPAVIGHARAGKLRMLAQTGKTRSQTAAEYPTMMEAGLPDYHVNSGFGLMAPKGLPAPITERINATLNAALQDAEVRRLLLTTGADPIGGTPQEHDLFLKSEVERWKRIGKQAGITPE